MKALKLSAEQMMATKLEADLVNKKVNHGKPGFKNEMGKDSFMKLLIAQLKFQDPTRPMEDREFIAQMAQFSSLEQMTNMNKEMTNLLKSQRSTESVSLLGKQIEALNPTTNRRITGIVSSIQYQGEEQVLMVGNEQVRIQDINSVRNPEPAAGSRAVDNAFMLNGMPLRATGIIEKANEQTGNKDVVLTK